jgi:1,4-dihydroxy-2-naphthoate octaprenyltransferase
MDTLRRFIKFIELSTKLASFTPYLTGIAYVFYFSGRIDVFYSLVLAAAVVLFDMPVTMINNYLDNKRSGKTPHFSRKVSLAWIFSMTGLSIVLGLYLTYTFGLVVLLVGMLCFFAGIFYTYGPIPISRTPYSEIVSGLVQGFCIIFLVVFINLPRGTLAEIHFDFVTFTLTINFLNLLRLGIVALPTIFCIANIMLANNICDVERDVLDKRYSLPYYIGRPKALILYRWLYLAAYASILAGIATGSLPIISLLSCLTLPLVWRNINKFSQAPEKSTTFVLSIANFVLILYAVIITLIIGRFIG